MNLSIHNESIILIEPSFRCSRTVYGTVDQINASVECHVGTAKKEEERHNVFNIWYMSVGTQSSKY